MSPFFYSYLITDPKEYGDDIKTFEKNLTKALETHHVDILCFRDKTTIDIIPLAKTCLVIAKRFQIKKTLLNGNIELAVSLGFDGVHLTSMQFDKIKEAKKKNLFTFISTHSEKEIIKAKEDGADGVTFSPIFYKENKATPKGCKYLQSLVDKYQDDQFMIIGLGGITDDDKIAQVQQTRCGGFASIGYFTSKL